MTINAGKMKEQIDNVRQEIGRDVTFYTSAHIACPLCTVSGYIDTLDGTSFYYQCPICAGSGYQSTVQATMVRARIHWTNDELRTATPGGKYYIGDCTLGVDIKYLTLAENAQSDSGKVVVDNHDMQITKIIPVGAPIINRYRLVCRTMGDRPS